MWSARGVTAVIISGKTSKQVAFLIQQKASERAQAIFSDPALDRVNARGMKALRWQAQPE